MNFKKINYIIDSTAVGSLGGNFVAAGIATALGVPATLPICLTGTIAGGAWMAYNSYTNYKE
jgi:uncharacterized protein (DUF2062 family)